MRFINKNKIPPQILKDLKARLLEEGRAFRFEELRNPDKNNFREILIAEQKHLCCYCEQEVENNPLKVVIEHFLPQSKFAHHELDYYNLHLACSQSNLHCDTVKKDELIINLLLHPSCESFFKYSLTGEILPNTHEYKNFDDFKNNLHKLSLRFQSVVNLISILELNKPELVRERKKTIDDLALLKDHLFNTVEKIDTYINTERAKDKRTRFPSLIEFYLNLLKEKI